MLYSVRYSRVVDKKNPTCILGGWGGGGVHFPAIPPFGCEPVTTVPILSGATVKGSSIPGLVLIDESCGGLYIIFNLNTSWYWGQKEFGILSDILSQAKEFVERRHLRTLSRRELQANTSLR